MHKICGPYRCNGKFLSYDGSVRFAPIEEIRHREPPDLSTRVAQIAEDQAFQRARIELFDAVIRGTTAFMAERKIPYVDLPMLTRMISSPGALNGSIPTDIAPFEVTFFSKPMYLSQSSQLYLEFAIAGTGVKQVYSVSKSFRRERADFRHLPEFSHIEYEGTLGFEQNMQLQMDYLKELIRFLIHSSSEAMRAFLGQPEIEALGESAEAWKVQRLTFKEAFCILYRKTSDAKFASVDREGAVLHLGAWEEVLLTEEFGGAPVFLTHFPSREVAFYHQNDLSDQSVAVNSDLLYPGYGEVIGAGERVRTRKETQDKATYFGLQSDDYAPYIESRTIGGEVVHSGWGMGCERFLQAVLKIPFIWETKPFPRVHNTLNP